MARNGAARPGAPHSCHIPLLPSGDEQSNEAGKMPKPEQTKPKPGPKPKPPRPVRFTDWAAI